MTAPGGASTQWLLVSTFRGEVGLVVAKGSAPQDVIAKDGGQQLHRALGRPRGELLNNARRTIRRAIHEQRPAVGPPLPIRGEVHRAVADPVLSGSGAPFAVWLWVGPEGEIAPSSPHPRTGAWMWDLGTRPVMATYGPRIGDLYGRPDLVPGRPYDINELTTAMTGDVASVAKHLLSEPVDGSRMSLSLTADRGRHGGGGLASLRATTELVHRPADNAWEWRGVTWDVTAVDPPVESPTRVAAGIVTGEGVWTATAYWWPIQLVDMTRTRLPEVYIDPGTHKAITHPKSRGVAAGLIAELSVGSSATAEIWLQTVDGDFAQYYVEAIRLRDPTIPAATISLRRAGNTLTPDVRQQ